MGIYESHWNNITLKESFKLLRESRANLREGLAENGRGNTTLVISRERTSAYMAYASTLLTLSGRASGHLSPKEAWRTKRIPDPRWLYLFVRCFFFMKPVTLKALDACDHDLDMMTIEEIDILQSVWRARAELYLRRTECLNEIVRVILVALKRAELHGEKTGVHTIGLLYAGLADVEATLGRYRMAIEHASIAISKADKAVYTDPNQAARIYKTCARVSKNLREWDGIPKGDCRLPNDSLLLDMAKKITTDTGARDQLLKIRATRA